jgi:sodium-coupled neutral amino acid transporter 11
MCAYLIILADNVTRVVGYYVQESIFAERAFVILISTLLIILPLSLARNLSFLGNFSLLALVSVFFIIMAIVVEAPGTISATPISLMRWSFIDSLGIISFAFVCHHNSFEIHDSLEIPSISSFATVTHFSTGISFLASVILAIPAYLCFSSATEANVLNNFAMSSLAINIARIGFAISLILTYPLDCFVAREVLIATLFGQTPPDWAHHLVTTLLVSVTLAVALGYTNLELVLELTGGLAASGLAFIFPAACYLKLAPDDEYSHHTRIMAKCLLIFGALVLVASTGNTLYRILH